MPLLCAEELVPGLIGDRGLSGLPVDIVFVSILIWLGPCRWPLRPDSVAVFIRDSFLSDSFAHSLPTDTEFPSRGGGKVRRSPLAWSRSLQVLEKSLSETGSSMDDSDPADQGSRSDSCPRLPPFSRIYLASFLALFCWDPMNGCAKRDYWCRNFWDL